VYSWQIDGALICQEAPSTQLGVSSPGMTKISYKTRSEEYPTFMNIVHVPMLEITRDGTSNCASQPKHSRSEGFVILLYPYNNLGAIATVGPGTRRAHWPSWAWDQLGPVGPGTRLAQWPSGAQAPFRPLAHILQMHAQPTGIHTS